jgi:hypothetical protein
MSDKSSEIIKAAAELAKAVPIYPDAIQPAAKQVGTALETVGRAVNVALMPIRALVWSAEQLDTFLQTRVAPKFRNTPPEHIVTPKANVVGPALLAVRFTEEDPDLQELFANLIASAMDERIAKRAFPAFVEIMKQLTSDEAKILRAIGAGRRVPMVHLDRIIFNDEGQHIGGYTIRKNLSLFGVVAGCKYPKLIPS